LLIILLHLAGTETAQQSVCRSLSWLCLLCLLRLAKDAPRGRGGLRWLPKQRHDGRRVIIPLRGKWIFVDSSGDSFE
jgi:hypothetical protein